MQANTLEQKIQFIQDILENKDFKYIPLPHDEVSMVYHLFHDGHVPLQEYFDSCRSGILEVYMALYCLILNPQHVPGCDEFCIRAFNKGNVLGGLISLVYYYPYTSDFSSRWLIEAKQQDLVEPIPFGGNRRIFDFYCYYHDPSDKIALIRSVRSLYRPACKTYTNINYEDTTNILLSQSLFNAEAICVLTEMRYGMGVSINQCLEKLHQCYKVYKHRQALSMMICWAPQDAALEILYEHKDVFWDVELKAHILSIVNNTLPINPIVQDILSDHSFFEENILPESHLKHLIAALRRERKYKKLLKIIS